MLSIFNGHYRTPSESGQRHFIQVECEVLKHLKDFTCSEWMVLTALGLHIDARGYCFPSVSRIQEVTGLTAPTIRTAIKGLCDKTIESKPVLLMRERTAKGGRQTSNEYIVFPQDANAFTRLDGEGEGENILRVASKNLVPLEQEQNNKKKTINSLPKDNDPAFLLWKAFWDTHNPFTERRLMAGEWKSVRHVLYQMVQNGITPDVMSGATSNLMLTWGSEFVTIHSLWKHWSKAVATEQKPKAKLTTIQQAQNASGIMARVNALMGGDND